MDLGIGIVDRSGDLLAAILEFAVEPQLAERGHHDRRRPLAVFVTSHPVGDCPQALLFGREPAVLIVVSNLPLVRAGARDVAKADLVHWAATADNMCDRMVSGTLVLELAGLADFIVPPSLAATRCGVDHLQRFDGFHQLVRRPSLGNGFGSHLLAQLRRGLDLVALQVRPRHEQWEAPSRGVDGRHQRA